MVGELQETPARENLGALYFDGGAIFGSVVLLVILLALSFERILGLDRIVIRFLRDWKEQQADERRRSIYEARLDLEKRWTDGDDIDSREIK
jgi:hypothetical protein